MLSVVKRYITNTSEAEDTLMEGFVKVFSKLDQYQGGGSFEGWIRKIMVNEALMSIRKNKDRYPVDIDAAFDIAHPDETLMQLGSQEIENLIASLPTGYRTIFNLIADAFKVPRPSKKVTPLLAAIVWRLEAVKAFFTGSSPLLTKETTLTAQAVVNFDNTKLLKALPDFSYTPLEETIHRVAAALTVKYDLKG